MAGLRVNLLILEVSKTKFNTLMQTSDSTRLILMFNTFGPTMAHKPSQNQVFPSWLIPLPTASSQSRLLMIAEYLVSRHKVVAGH